MPDPSWRDAIKADAEALKAYAYTAPDLKGNDVRQHQWVEEELTLRWGPDIALAAGIKKEWDDLTDTEDPNDPRTRTNAEWRDLGNDLIGIARGIKRALGFLGSPCD